MSSKFSTFKDLHQSDRSFILPNAWDAKSAVLFQENKFPAIGTSSAAVATSLGYEDGEGMPFADYLFVIKQILSCLQIPLTVDMEMGYGKTNEEIFVNMLQLIDLGVAGINIEDSSVNPSGRALKEAAVFAKTIEYVKNKLASKKLNLFINIRCDTYILNVENKLKETISRLNIYETTGADGIFLPCISNTDDIAQAVSNTKLPLNVMCIPGLPDFNTLHKLGVKRISMGPFLFNKLYSNITKLSQEIFTTQNFSSLLS
ncbi:MAG TPA: isocitrate lyase/phosphoenolpyruvate mutase family protein [Chitinophagaceae bacterium]